MKLKHAMLCLDCDCIHDGHQCPSCASKAVTPISRWIRPMSEAKDDPEPSRLGEILAPCLDGMSVHTYRPRPRLRVVR